MWGYDIHYDAGDEYYMVEADTHAYLLPEADTTIAAADELGFDSADYDLVDRVDVREEDGRYVNTTVFRYRKTGGVCLFFGGADYEGLPDMYSYVDGVLRDGDGVRLQTRVLSEHTEHTGRSGGE